MNIAARYPTRLSRLVNQFSSVPGKGPDFAVRAWVKLKPGIACQILQSRAGRCDGSGR